MQCNAMQCNAMQCNAMHRNAPNIIVYAILILIPYIPIISYNLFATTSCHCDTRLASWPMNCREIRFCLALHNAFIWVLSSLELSAACEILDGIRWTEKPPCQSGGKLDLATTLHIKALCVSDVLYHSRALSNCFPVLWPNQFQHRDDHAALSRWVTLREYRASGGLFLKVSNAPVALKRTRVSRVTMLDAGK